MTLDGSCPAWRAECWTGLPQRDSNRGLDFQPIENATPPPPWPAAKSERRLLRLRHFPLRDSASEGSLRYRRDSTACAPLAMPPERRPDRPLLPAAEHSCCHSSTRTLPCPAAQYRLLEVQGDQGKSHHHEIQVTLCDTIPDTEPFSLPITPIKVFYTINSTQTVSLFFVHCETPPSPPARHWPMKLPDMLPSSNARTLARLAVLALLASCERSAVQPFPSPTPSEVNSAQSKTKNQNKPLPQATRQLSASEGNCCMGRNACKGQGGCAVPESHLCAGKNACEGRGGCRAHCPQ